MASGAVTPLVQYLLRLLDEEIDLLVGVKDEVDSIHKELILIQTFLDNSEGRHSDDIRKEVVRQIREVAYEIEDVIARYILETAEQSRANWALKAISFVGYLLKFHSLGKKIKGLNKKINKILENQRTFGTEIAEAVGSAVPNEALHRCRRYVEENGVEGFFSDSATLVERLTGGNPTLDVISIIGMGGLGKTTLARKIYMDDSINRHFDCCSWGYVSQDFKAKELLLEILTSHTTISDRDALTKKIAGMSTDEIQIRYLVDELYNYLQGKRYLVVMDDVWSTDVWEQVRNAFPNNINGSRILITSRNKIVASSFARATPPHFLSFLNEDESWKLLQKKAFGCDTSPPDLEDLGRQMVKGCGGLPISIVALGNFLAGQERTYEIWCQRVSYVEGNFIAKNTKICKDILALSYIRLPREFKLCFLYIGVYPKDYEIPIGQLIQLWIAEGFIQQTERRKEDTAEVKYLETLIDQNLIQVVSRRTDRGVKKCRIHDLLRDICISECKEEMFLEVIGHVNLSSTNKSRRLSFHGSNLECISSKCARSLLFFGKDRFEFDPSHWQWILKHLTLVRVLYFEKVNLYSIPSKIKNLILLKYLRIGSRELKDIPTAICNLTNLETLDMRGTFLNRLPKGIWKLSCLKNLYMSGPVSLPKDLDPDVEVLWNLQVLSTVSLNPQNVSHITPTVRKLGIWFASDESDCRTADVLATLFRFSYLQTLKIINCSEGPRLPASFPKTITKITLLEVLLIRRDIKVLGSLPKLRILKLESCVSSGTLRVFRNSFRELQVLKLDNLTIETWKLNSNSMLSLKHLVIKKCFRLTTLPRQLRKLKVLQDVTVSQSNSNVTSMFMGLQRHLGFELL